MDVLQKQDVSVIHEHYTNQFNDDLIEYIEVW